MKVVSKSLEETKKAAEMFVEMLEPRDHAVVVRLEGDLGAGKTAFSQAIGEVLGVSDIMHSPTFVIEKIYPINYRGFTRLIHIDAYRLDKESELLHLGWEEITKEKENLILIEWPERVPGIIPLDALRISFVFVDEETREIDMHE